MLRSTLSRAVRSVATTRNVRNFSDIPINRVASVLKLNVGNLETAIKMDTHMKAVHEQMKAHPGFNGTTRTVCKSEWAYELSFIFESLDSFKAWNESKLRETVHPSYQKGLDDCGIKEADVYSGVRVHDDWA